MSNQKIAGTRIVFEEKAVVWTFEDGTTSTIRLDELPADVVAYAALDRIRAKATDCYAASADQDDPLGWAKDQHEAVVAALKEGDWNRGGSVAGLVYEAIAIASQQPLETVLAAFNAMSKDKRENRLKALRKQKPFKAAYTKLQADRAAKKAAEAAPLNLEDFT